MVTRLAVAASAPSKERGSRIRRDRSPRMTAAATGSPSTRQVFGASALPTCRGSFYRLARGGELGRITDGWGRWCRSWCRRSREVGAGGRSGMSRRPMLSSRPRVRLRSRWCCQRAEAVCSCAAPVGRGSLGWMPLAARHTATSPMMARFGRLPAGAQTGWVSSWPA